AEEAEVVGTSLIGANLRGYDSHGVMRIPFYLKMLEAGDAHSGAALNVLSETPTSIVADANWGLGRVQCGRLLEGLTEKARQNGMAAGTLHNCSHIGRLGEYCEIAAAAGLVSIMMANTHGAARRVAPPGGTAPRLGTNPLAMGVPHRDEPLVLDFSTSVTAEGKVRVKSIAGETCPEGWLLDSEGRPTTDPNDLYTDPPGTILPMGGSQAYKGFGLALMVDIFAGALSGGLCARETPITPKGNCLFLYLLDPAQMGGEEAYREQVNGLVDFVRGCPTVEGVDEILLPGDPERKSLARHHAGGFQIDEENWQQLSDLAAELGVTAPAD
ncbi:MAG: Ldh family oxidoreductase, partial [Pirellulaceae bacterium]|nr:Ldh family oxidoreductase [Pirellulaceae bacterium]